MDWDSFFIGFAAGIVAACAAMVSLFFVLAEREDHP